VRPKVLILFRQCRVFGNLHL